jgi:hypothetical protein
MLHINPSPLIRKFSHDWPRRKLLRIAQVQPEAEKLPKKSTFKTTDDCYGADAERSLWRARIREKAIERNVPRKAD